jgi:hypothetical protein
MNLLVAAPLCARRSRPLAQINLPAAAPQTFTDLYFWLLGTIAVLGAGVPYARRVAGPFGKPTLKVPLPEGLATDDAQQPVTEARAGGQPHAPTTALPAALSPPPLSPPPLSRAHILTVSAHSRFKTVLTLIPSPKKQNEQMEVAPSDLVVALAAVGLSSYELLSHHSAFTANNAIACLIASDILQLLGLRSFRTAGLLLALMLAYDVFWRVFWLPRCTRATIITSASRSRAGALRPCRRSAPPSASAGSSARPRPSATTSC